MLIQTATPWMSFGSLLSLRAGVRSTSGCVEILPIGEVPGSDNKTSVDGSFGQV
jgi:hypothetical protein